MEDKKFSEAMARHIAEVRASRERIAPIPADLKVNPQHLDRLTHEQFLKALGELQQFIINCYKDIERDPIIWGYPDPYKRKSGNGSISIGPHENRLASFLFAFSAASEQDADALTVDYKKFNKKLNRRWKQAKPETMFKEFARYGLIIENFNKKATHFTVKFPANTHPSFMYTASFTAPPTAPPSPMI
ncbi:MAG: hypothetical protein FWF80_03595 [Defluviitaleaceae bacterium]|nr:hypothetical protein [Defluviitaleaceae bacterium]